MRFKVLSNLINNTPIFYYFVNIHYFLLVIDFLPFFFFSNNNKTLILNNVLKKKLIFKVKKNQQSSYNLAIKNFFLAPRKVTSSTFLYNFKRVKPTSNFFKTILYSSFVRSIQKFAIFFFQKTFNSSFFYIIGGIMLPYALEFENKKK
jgi:hypothetical protein